MQWLIVDCSTTMLSIIYTDGLNQYIIVEIKSFNYLINYTLNVILILKVYLIIINSLFWRCKL